MANRVLVLGPTSMIGRHVVSELNASGNWQVQLLVRQTSNLAGIDQQKNQITVGDLRDIALLRNLVQSCDFLINCAGNASSGNAPELLREQEFLNIEVPRQLVQCLKEGSVKRLVHLSTVLAFGQRNTMIRDHMIPQGEFSNNFYIKSKRQGEIELEGIAKAGVELVTFNPSITLGFWDFKNWAMVFRDILLGRKEFFPDLHCSLVDATQVARSMVNAIEIQNPEPRYLLGSPLHSFEEILAELEQILNQSIKFPKIIRGRHLETLIALDPGGSVARYSGVIGCQSELAKRDLGFNESSLNHKLTVMVNWLREGGYLN